MVSGVLKISGIAFTLGIGLSAVGFVVGLLFSVPRAAGFASSNDSSRSNQAEASRPAQIYAPNTNLEQISDWLTKIIVGVSLVEAQSIRIIAQRSADAIGIAFASEGSITPTAGKMLALGMIFAFPTLGFLVGYFAVRLYISGALYAADSEILQPIEIQTRVSALLGAASALGQSTAEQGRSDLTPTAVQDTAEDVRRLVTIDSLRSFSSAWILWVDDRPSNNELLINAFRSLGIIVDISLSTEDAMSKLTSGRRYEAIITDMGRPPDSQAGYTLLSEMKQHGIRIPTIVYAGSDSEEHRQMARSAGAVDSTNRPKRVFDFVASAISESKA